jgi:hypothetical protein
MSEILSSSSDNSDDDYECSGKTAAVIATILFLVAVACIPLASIAFYAQGQLNGNLHAVQCNMTGSSEPHFGTWLMGACNFAKISSISCTMKSESNFNTSTNSSSASTSNSTFISTLKVTLFEAEMDLPKLQMLGGAISGIQCVKQDDLNLPPNYGVVELLCDTDRKYSGSHNEPIKCIQGAYSASGWKEGLIVSVIYIVGCLFILFYISYISKRSTTRKSAPPPHSASHPSLVDGPDVV